MQLRKTNLAVAACLALSAATAQAASAYYVSCNGSDTANNGTTGAPWATMAKANAAAVSGNTVYLARNCTFRETLYVKSGVTYTAYGSGLKPIISGSVPVGGLTWTLAPANVQPKAPIGGSTPAASIYMADATSVIGTNKLEQLYLNGVRLTRARMPNIGEGSYSVVDSAGKPSSRYLAASANGNGTTLNLNATPVDASRPWKSVVPADADIQNATAYIRTVGSDLFEYKVKNWAVDGSNTPIANTLALEHKSIIDGVLDPAVVNPFWDPYYLDYAINKGAGYWLENKLWMLDAPGEWFFDETTKLLYVWLPNGTPPAQKPLYAAVLDAGVVASNATRFRVQGIEVRETRRDAFAITNGSAGSIVQVDVMRPGLRGIAISGGSGYNIQYANVVDSVRAGIWLGDERRADYAKPSLNTTIQYTTVKNAGKDQFANAAMVLGYGTKVLNSVIQNASAGGMIVSKNSTISNNLIQGSCTDFTDCGGIYVGTIFKDGGPMNTIISQNIVDGGPGSSDGVNGIDDNTRGIYLDDFVDTVTVSGNFVRGMRFGFMLHSARNNTLTRNKSADNRFVDLLMQEDVVGRMVNNVVSQNVFASKTRTTPHIWQVSTPDIDNPSGNVNFATYTNNIYAASNADQLLYNDYKRCSTNSTTNVTSCTPDGKAMTFAQWQATGKDAGSVFKALTPDEDAAYSFYNSANAAATTASCPAKNSANCTAYVDLSTLKASTPTKVTFPLALPTNSSILIGRY